MKFVREKLKESSNLVLAIFLAFVFAVFIGGIHLVDQFRVNINPDTTRFMPGTVYTCLIIWMVAVLWVAYRRWRLVVIPDKELEDLITGINPDAFIVIDPERRVRMCNSTVNKMFGYDPSELLGHTTDLLYYDRRPAQTGDHSIYEQLARLGFHVGYATGKHRSGRTIPLEIITGTIKHRQGAVLLIRDITQRVQAEEAHREKTDLLQKLETNYSKLVETERARDNLLHMIVHDMKSPLQVILGTTELLKEDLLSDQKEMSHMYVDETLEHTRRLIEMVNSLLDVSRLEAGEMPLQCGSCDLRTLAKRAIASLSFLVNGRTINVHLPQEPTVVSCDPEIMRRVLVNLISNGLYHTPEDASISLSLIPDGHRVRVEVTDNGPGIPREYHEKIFEKFAQVKAGQIRRSGSTGIGLTFCRLAVKAHGGEIGVHSEVGKGSTFWFILPLHAAAHAEMAKRTDPGVTHGPS